MILRISQKLFTYWPIGLLIIVVLNLGILNRIFFFPYPEFFIYSYLTVKGLIPYAQIFDQHFPGLMFFPLNLYSLGMTTPQIARYWHLILVVLTQIILFFAAKKIFKSNKLALAVNFLYLVFQPFYEGYVFWIETFVTPLLLLSFYLLLNYKSRINLFIGGLFIGIALLFKQVVLPGACLVFIYLIFFNKPIKKNVLFVLGFSIPVLILIIYVTKLNIWKDFIYWTVTFNLTVFSEMGRKFMTLSEFIKTAPVFLAPLLYLFYITLKEKKEIYYYLIVFYLGSFMFIYARFDFIHLQPILPFALISLVLFFSKLNRKVLLVILGIYIFFSFWILAPFYRLAKDRKIFFFGNFENKLISEVERYAKRNDSIFVMGTSQHLYYLTNTLPPGRIFVFQFPWFMKVAGSKVLAGLKNDPPKVVFRDKSAQVQGMTLVDYFGEINPYIEDRYKVVDNISGTEILIPK